MNRHLYQFNLDFQTRYIQGYIVSEDDNFIEIEIKNIGIVAHNIKPSDNIVRISKKAIVCYFKIV